VTATYPEGYFPGSEEERQRLADAARIRDAKAEAERVAALPEPEEAPPPVPGLSEAERAELNALRAEALSTNEREELDRLRSAQGGNRPYNGDEK
jgi:hypothetical protein